MSSDSSVTVRADSGEPPAKRQKTFDYGPDIVTLQACDEKGVYSTVAHVSGIRYHKFCLAMELKPCYAVTKCVDGVQIKQIKLNHYKSLVKFYAHCINERDVEAALDICKPENITWPEFACDVLKFWHEEDLHHDLRDTMVDLIIGRLQARRQKRFPPAYLIKKLYYAVGDVEQASETGTNFTRDTKLRDMLATLYLHHQKDQLLSQDRLSLEDSRLLDLKHDIKVVAMSLLLNASTEGDFSKFPKDILANDFDQHCRYHLHGEQGTCYKQKPYWKG